MGRYGGPGAKAGFSGRADLVRRLSAVPHPLDGGLFKVGSIVPVTRSDVPEGLTVQAWDLASTVAKGGNDPDWTVGVKLRLERPGQFLVLDGTAVHIGFLEDPGQAGKSRVSHHVGLLAGFHVVASRESGSKVIRAQPLSAQIDQGKLSIVRGDWNGISRRNFVASRSATRTTKSMPWSERLKPSTRYPIRKTNIPFLVR